MGYVVSGWLVSGWSGPHLSPLSEVDDVPVHMLSPLSDDGLDDRTTYLGDFCARLQSRLHPQGLCYDLDTMFLCGR